MDSKIIASSALMGFILMLRLYGTEAQLGFTPTTASVAENSAADTSVADLTGTGGSPPYTFALTSNEFKIATAQIQVKTGATLNFEGTNSYALNVSVTSGGNTAYQIITVSLTNVNEAPTFAMNMYSFNVDNGAGADVQVGQVMATDVDASDTLTYSLTAGNTDTLFAITSMGYIKVNTAKTTNSTAQSAYMLTATVSDAGSLSDTTTVYVGINLCSGVARVTGGMVPFLIGVVALLVQIFI